MDAKKIIATQLLGNGKRLSVNGSYCDVYSNKKSHPFKIAFTYSPPASKLLRDLLRFVPE